MSNKRGSVRVPIERRKSVRVSVAVTPDVADVLFGYARQKREPLSVILNRICERLVEREKQLAVYQTSEKGWPLAR